MLNTRIYCQICGKELNDTDIVCDSFVCIDCQSETYRQLEEVNGCHLAIFHTCAAYNVPCEPLVIPSDFADFEGDKWSKYLELLKEHDKLYENGNFRTFFDGEKNMRRIFGKEMSQTDFAKFISTEQERISKLPGTERQRKYWGTGNLYVNMPYTTEIYNELDRDFEARAAEFKGQSLSVQQIDTLKRVCKRTVVIDYLEKTDNADKAVKLQKMIQVDLESEQMRKKDEKPSETMRPDAWIDAWEKAGLMENGAFITREELDDVIIKIFRGKGYNQSIDTINQLELNIINNARKNEDKPILYSLPKEMKIKDELGEYTKKETEIEKQRKKDTNLVTVAFEK